MLKYACEFTVTGVGNLPIDMLRYDRATPLTQSDASQSFVEGEAAFTEGNERPIRLVRYTEGKGRNYADNPTVKRWNSFGWQVTDITWRKL
jgi:hypothetical protein